MISLLFALCMGLVPVGGWAACTLKNDVTTPTKDNAVIAYLSGFNAAVDVSRPDGSILYSTGTKYLDPTSGHYSCTNDPHTYSYRGLPGSPIGNVYPTTISGIGMKIKYPGPNMDFPSEQTYQLSGERVNINWKGGQGIEIQLIKTGPITAGGTLTGEFAGVFAKERTGMETQIASFMFKEGVVITANVPTCTVDTQSKLIPVTMDTVAAGDFKGEGSNAGAKRDFKIDLSCSGGAADTSTNVHITLTDHNEPGNTGDVLSLTPGPTAASGIGLNIFKGGTSDKITFGTASSAGTVSQSPGTTSFSIPLSAQYVQTGPTVTAGTANAVATFTISYQ